MSLTWLATYFLSSSWLFLTPIFDSNHRWGLLLVLVGTVLNVNTLACTRIQKPGMNAFLLLCIPLSVIALMIPFPYNLGFFAIIAGIAASTLQTDGRRGSSNGAGLIFSGIILLAQVAVLPFYFKCASRYSEIPGFSASVYQILQLLGVNGFAVRGNVAVEASKQVFHFSTELGKIGFYPWLNATLGAFFITIIFVRRKRVFWLAFIGFTAFVYLVIRYVALILLYATTENSNLFWNPWVSLVSFLPLMLFYGKTVALEIPLNNGFLDMSIFRKIGNFDLFSVVFMFAGIFLSVGFFGFHDPGEGKLGRILIDEKHSNWEWTTREYDTEWFGRKSGYNYYCLADYLDHFYTVTKNDKHITSDVLSNYDILLIKTPTSIYLKEEIEAIRDFVDRGGGLFLIGDHTNVFGTSFYINPIAEQFGLWFNYDATYDLLTGDLSVYERPKLLPHPVVQHLPPFLFGSSCTLEAPFAAEDVITGYQMKSIRLDYSQKNFFPENINDPSMKFGLFLQCAATLYGKGRVLAFTDSTVFSNFWVFMPGKSELLLSSIDWLNRKNRYPPFTQVSMFIAGIFLSGISFFLVLKKTNGSEATFTFLFAAILAIPVSIFIYQSLNHHYYRMPIPHTRFTKIYFESEHSDILLPITALVNNLEKSYETFYVWTQRLGYVPTVVPHLSEAMQGDALVIINASTPFNDKQKKKVIDYVDQGGRLIVMDSSFNKNSTSNEILALFDMKLSFEPRQDSFFLDALGQRIATTIYSGIVKGGKPVLIAQDKEPILSQTRRGKGLVVVMVDSMLFSDRMLGTTGIEPNSEQRRLYELEFWLLRELLGGSQSPFQGEDRGFRLRPPCQ